MNKTIPLFIGLLVLLLTPARLTASELQLLKVQSGYGLELPGMGTTVTYLAETVNSINASSLQLKVYAPNKLVAPFEILDVVSSRKIQAGFATAGFWAGKIPSSPLFSSVPFGPEAGEYIAWLYYGNGLKLYQQMYDQAGYNVKVLPCGVVVPETSGWFARRIESVEDLKGLKMRFFGLGGKVMSRLGVAVSVMPAGDLFSALEKGAIDATEFSTPAIDQRLGFHKVVKYNYFPGWHQQATILEFLVNGDVWRDLGRERQAILKAGCRSAITMSIAEGEYLQGAAMEKNRDKYQVKTQRWSSEMLAAFEREWEGVVQEESEKDAFFAMAYNDMKTFRQQYLLWKTHGFLPRD